MGFNDVDVDTDRLGATHTVSYRQRDDMFTDRQVVLGEAGTAADAAVNIGSPGKTFSFKLTVLFVTGITGKGDKLPVNNCLIIDGLNNVDLGQSVVPGGHRDRNNRRTE